MKSEFNARLEKWNIVALCLVGVLFAGCGAPKPFTFSETDHQNLIAAIDADKPRPVQDYFDRGMDPNARDPQGTPYLLRAAEKHYTDIVLTFLNNRADPNVADAEGKTALMIAAERGYSDMVDRLLGLGADFKRATTGGAKPGRTALHFAAQNGHLDILRSLLKRGADPKARDAEGKTAADVAQENNQPRAADILHDNGAPPTPNKTG